MLHITVTHAFILDKAKGFVSYIINGTAHNIHLSPLSILSKVKDDLSCIIHETRLCGIQVSTDTLDHEACHLFPNFRSKTLEARKKSSHDSPNEWGSLTSHQPIMSRRTYMHRGRAKALHRVHGTTFAYIQGHIKWMHFEQ